MVLLGSEEAFRGTKGPMAVLSEATGWSGRHPKN